MNIITMDYTNCMQIKITKKSNKKGITLRRKVLKLHLQTSQRAASWKGGGSNDIIVMLR